MPRVLGIDTSLTGTGLARVDIEIRPDYTWDIAVATVSAPKPGREKSKRAMIRRVNALIEDIEAAIEPTDPLNTDRLPDLIAIEALAFGARGASVWVLPYIFGRTIELAEKYNIAVIEVGTGQIKKYATGAGNSDKSTVVIAVSKRWPEADVKNDNEADAMTAAAIGCDYLGYPIVGSVSKYHQEVIAKIRETHA